MTRKIRLDVACGSRKGAMPDGTVEPGWTGIDIAGDADIVHDLFVTPWPLADRSVREARVSHFAEHIPHYLPQHGRRDVWWVFWEEVWRVCAPGATVTVIHPYVRSDRAFWDPTHTRYIHEATWMYLNAEWRRAQGLDHYETTADFDVVVVAALGVPDDYMARSDTAQAFAREHYWNPFADLSVTLKRR